MTVRKVRITYKHWKKPEVTLVVEGTLPKNLNNPTNDRWVVKLDNGEWEDVIKTTVVKLEDLPV